MSAKMKSFSYFAILVCLFICVSCGNNGSSLKAGFLVHTLQDERWAIERDAFTKKFTELGGTVTFENANQDERSQFHIAKKMIEEEKIKVLVIVPVNSKTAASIARMCQENGVKLIAYDIIIENSDIDLFVSFDNEKVGEQMARYAVERKPKGNYILLWGDSNMLITHWIKDGQMKVLDPLIKSKQINICYQGFVENWSGTNAEFMMKRVLDFSDDSVDAILASADGIAQGVIDAYDYNHITEFPLLTGQDASTGAISHIRNHKQSMTIRKPFNELAEKAALCAYDLAKNKKIPADTVLFNGHKNIPSILLEPTIIDQNNLPNQTASN